VSNESVTALDSFAAPYGREVTLESVEYESDLRMFRIRIREGRRFTVMDIDEDTAMRWGSAMSTWADKARALGA